MTVGIKQADRMRLTGQRIVLELKDAEGAAYKYHMDIDRYLGEGTSCICYEVTVYKDVREIGQKCVLKQFYPDPLSFGIDAEMEGVRLQIQGYADDPERSRNPNVSRLGAFFEQAFRHQLELSNEEKLHDIIVRPTEWYFDGETKYILYEADFGTSLDIGRIRSLEDFLKKMRDIAEALCRLHERGIIYMDLKPSNILVSSNGTIKLFDFDAAIDRKHLDRVRLEDGSLRYDAGTPGLVAPEIRGRNLDEFNRNKYHFISASVDIYALGAIMFSYFMNRYPTDADCEHAAYEAELQAQLEGRFRGELIEEEQKILKKILRKSIDVDLSPSGRYFITAALLRDINRLLASMKTPRSAKERIYQKTGDRLQTAYVMDQFPLSEYRVHVGKQGWIMDSLLIGNGPVGAGFLTNILASTQMLQTKHVVRYALTGAEQAIKDYVRRWPMLAKTTTIYLDDAPWKPDWEGLRSELDPEITETPFAELRFYEWSAETDAAEWFLSLARARDISWIAVCDEQAERNLTIAKVLASAITVCPKWKKKPMFMAYLDSRGDGYDLRKPDQSYENIHLFPFGDNAKKSLDEKQFARGIRKRALQLHKFYMRQWKERASAAEIWEDFTGSDYNINSSLTCALSLPYKLASLGISGTGRAAAEEYRRSVLDSKQPGAAERFDRLIYLEHRRWMCFMMTEGYDRPDWKELEHYAFRGNHDQRDRTRKLHPCICASDPEHGIRLGALSREAWDTPEIWKRGADGMAFDPLDAMSLRFHQFCDRSVRSMERDGVFEAAFGKLEYAMRNDGFTAEDREALEALRGRMHRMVSGESGANRLWELGCRRFAGLLAERAAVSAVRTEEAAGAFRELKRQMRIVAERNLCHDYKSSDRTILEALPLLLMSDDPIRRIHRPVTEKTWQNVVTSMIIEPEELYLYAEESDRVNGDRIRDFLTEERGIRLERFEVRPMEALTKLRVSARARKSVLDLTGLSEEACAALLRHEKLRRLPAIAYRGGQLRSLNCVGEAENYRSQRRHFTVGEALGLSGCAYERDSRMDRIADFPDDCEAVWNAGMEADAEAFQVLMGVLRAAEAGHYRRIDRGGQTDAVSIERHEESQGSYAPHASNGSSVFKSGFGYEKRRVHPTMLRISGIDRVLRDLWEQGWLEAEAVLPRADRPGTVRVETKYEAVYRCVEHMMETAEREPYLHHFSYRKTAEDPAVGRKSSEEQHFVYDDTLIVQTAVVPRDWGVEDSAGLRAAVEEILGRLAHRDREDRALVECLHEDDCTFTTEAPGASEAFLLRLLYRDRAARTCLACEENLLEAYVYHTVWKRTTVDDVKRMVMRCGAGPEAEAISCLACARGLQTWFIACRHSFPDAGALERLRDCAERYGTDGHAVVVTDAPVTEEEREHCRALRIACIDRSMFVDGPPDACGRRLAECLQRIFGRNRSLDGDTGGIE